MRKTLEIRNFRGFLCPKIFDWISRLFTDPDGFFVVNDELTGQFWPFWAIFNRDLYVSRRTAESSSCRASLSFQKNKPLYIARWLFNDSYRVFPFLQALQNHQKNEGGLIDGKRNDHGRRRTLLRWPSAKLQRLFLPEKTESRMHPQKRELLLPGGVSETDFTLSDIVADLQDA